MRDPEGIVLIRKIREELLREKESMSPDEWEKLSHERAQIMEKRIAAQRAKNISEQHLVHVGDASDSQPFTR